MVAPVPGLCGVLQLADIRRPPAPVWGWIHEDHTVEALVAAPVNSDGKTVHTWCIHDLRRTCVSGMAPLGIALHVADKILIKLKGRQAELLRDPHD